MSDWHTSGIRRSMQVGLSLFYFILPFWLGNFFSWFQLMLVWHTYTCTCTHIETENEIKRMSKIKYTKPNSKIDEKCAHTNTHTPCAYIYSAQHVTCFWNFTYTWRECTRNQFKYMIHSSVYHLNFVVTKRARKDFKIGDQEKQEENRGQCHQPKKYVVAFVTQSRFSFDGIRI